MSRAWANIGKSLACRAVIFDRRALTFVEGEKAISNVSAQGATVAGLGTSRTLMRQTEKVVATGNVKDLLQHEIREELKMRGANPVGKRWEIAQRLQDILDEEKLAKELLPGATADPKPPEASLLKQHDLNHTASVRDKYANKISAKLSATLARKGLSTQLEHTLPDERQAWNLQPGVRELLQYIEMRGMMRIMLANEVDSDDEAEKQGSQITKSLKLSPFSMVIPCELERSLRAGEGSSVKRLADMLELEPKRIMLVSDHRPSISAARSGRAFSCYVAKNVDGVPSRVPSDFVIKTIAEVKDAIEELNGITFRTADTEIKTKYGVNCT